MIEDRIERLGSNPADTIPPKHGHFLLRSLLTWGARQTQEHSINLATERLDRLNTFFGTLDRSATKLNQPVLARVYQSLQENPDGEFDLTGLTRDQAEIVFLTTKLAESTANYDKSEGRSAIAVFEGVSKDGAVWGRSNSASGLRNQEAVSQLKLLLGVNQHPIDTTPMKYGYPTYIPWVIWRHKTGAPEKITLEVQELSPSESGYRLAKWGLPSNPHSNT